MKAFLIFVGKTYPSYIDNKEVVFKDEDFTDKNMRKTVLKTTKHYAADKA